MSKLNLRPEKKEKDRQRLVKLAQLLDKKVTASNSIEDIFKRVKRLITRKELLQRQRRMHRYLYLRLNV